MYLSLSRSTYLDQDTPNLSFDDPTPQKNFTEPEPEVKKAESTTKTARFGLAIFGIALFFIFLILKIPEARLQNYLLAHIRIESQKMGYLFNAEKISLGLLLGPSLKLTNVELKPIDNDQNVLKIDYLKVKPNLFSMLPFSKIKKISFDAELFGGAADGTVGLGQNTYLIDVSASKVSLPKLIPILLPNTPLTVSAAVLSAQVDLVINMDQIQTSEGRIEAELKPLSTPQQSLYGFNLPALSISESAIDISVSGGKAMIRKFELGKDANKDDVVAKVTGDATIDGQKNIYNPLARLKLNLKAAFELSAKVKSSFTFLDAILGPAKGSDGKYTYSVSGTAAAPVPRAGG